MKPNDPTGAKNKGKGHCPDESEILGFFEDQLAPAQKNQVQSHLVDCTDCRELIALFVQSSSAAADGEVIIRGPEPSNMGELAVRNQVARVLSMIEQDDHRTPPPEEPAPHKRSRGLMRFKLAFSLAAAFLLAASVYFLVRSGSPEQPAYEALASARGNQRQVEPRTSANLPYARFSRTRGDNVSAAPGNEIYFERALNLLRDAEKESAPASSRLALARVYLERGRPGDAQQARTILTHLKDGGVQTAEVFNDLGVASFELNDFEASANHFSQALNMDPRFSRARFNLALALEAQKRNEEAINEWNRFLQESSEDDWKSEARDHLERLNQSSAR